MPSLAVLPGGTTTRGSNKAHHLLRVRIFRYCGSDEGLTNFPPTEIPVAAAPEALLQVCLPEPDLCTPAVPQQGHLAAQSLLY